MAIIINTVDVNYFELNGERYATIYQPLVTNVSEVAIYNVYDTKLQLLGATDFSDFVVDGNTYASRDLLIDALLPVIYKNVAGSGGTASWGSITGTLSAQTDLQSALNAKSNVGHTHVTSDITNLGTYTGFDTRYYTKTQADSLFITEAPVDGLEYVRKNGAWSVGVAQLQGLQSVTTRGATTTDNITATSFITSGGSASDFVKGDGSLDSTTYSGVIGTPTNNQLAVWTGATGIEGTAILTLSGSELTIDGSASADWMVFNPLTSAPVTPVEGMMYYDDTNNHFKYYDGTSFKELGSGGGGGSVSWGNITGTLSNQTDLQNALDAKQNSSTAFTVTREFNNSVSDTSDLNNGGSGFWYANTGTPNQSPIGNSFILGADISGGFAVQMAMRQNRLFYRGEESSVWGTWGEIYHSQITGTVDYSNAGTVKLANNAGTVDINGVLRMFVSSSDTAHQRADARDDATTQSRLHWYGVTDTGGTTNFRHAWYDGSAYIDVTAQNGGVEWYSGDSGDSYFDFNAGSAGDAIIRVIADFDNNNENDIPRMQFLRDAGTVGMDIGSTGNAGVPYTGVIANSGYIYSPGLDFVGTGGKHTRLDNTGNLTMSGSISGATSYLGGQVAVENPNNSNASVTLSWVSDDPRLRIGGSGAGSGGTFRIQGTGDTNRLSVASNGDVTAHNHLFAWGGSLYLDNPTKRALRGDDSWLRLNPDGSFTSGIYISSSARLRVDSFIDIGSTGANRWDGSGLDIYGTSLEMLRLRNANSGQDGGYIRAQSQGSVNQWYFGRPSATSSYAQWYSYRGTNYFRLNDSGTNTIGGATTATSTITATDFILSSDERKKSYIRPLERETPEVEFKSYFMEDHPDRIRYGVIAQDLEETHPELITTGEDGMKAVSYNDLFVLLIEKLREENRDLRKDVELLKMMVK